MRRISEIIEIRIHVKRPLASGWAGLSPCSGRGPWTWLAYLPAQDWPVFLLRKRVPDWTGLSPCSGTGSQTRLACLSAQEEGLASWTGLASLPKKRDLDFARANIVLLITAFSGFMKIIKRKNSISCRRQSDTCIFPRYQKHKTSMGKHFYLSNQKILLGAHYMHKKECYGRYTLTWFWVWSFWGAP